MYLIRMEEIHKEVSAQISAIRVLPAKPDWSPEESGRYGDKAQLRNEEFELRNDEIQLRGRFCLQRESRG